MAEVRCDVYVRYDGPVGHDRKRAPVVVCKGEHVTQSEAPMVYGPRITLDGRDYDLLLPDPSCPRAMAVPAEALVWLCPPVGIDDGREYRLHGVRLVEHVAGVWVEH